MKIFTFTKNQGGINGKLSVKSKDERNNRHNSLNYKIFGSNQLNFACERVMTFLYSDSKINIAG